MDFNQTNENLAIESSFFVTKEVLSHEKLRQVDAETEEKKEDDVEIKKKAGLKKDAKTIFLLMYLYFLQGLPLGLAGSIPFILTSKKASFSDQGTFSFVFWPFSIKLLWAPIVDSVFWARFGRRKSWLIPVQFLIGITLFSFASYSESILYNIQSNSDIIILTLIFGFTTLLTATQDIALDGWAINMLSKENVSWQSTCNGVGQTAGAICGNVLFIVFESTKFSNQYFRPFLNLPPQDYGIVSLKMFMYFIGSVFIITSIVVAIFKKEKDSLKDAQEEIHLISSYKMIIRLFRLKPIRIISFIYLTIKIGLAAESVNFLKLIEQGVSKEKMSLLNIPLTPINIFWPLVISKWTNGDRPFSLYFKTMPFRLCLSVILMMFICVTPYFRNDSDGEYPFYYFILCLLLFSVTSILDSTMFIASLSFNAKVADELIGGTYMTLLATLGNLGGTYPSTISLYLVDLFSIKYCSDENFYDNLRSLNSSLLMKSDFELNQTLSSLKQNTCSSKKLSKACSSMGGSCVTTFDAYYYLVLVFTVYGLLWCLFSRKLVRRLNHTPKSDWSVFKLKENNISS